MKLLFMIRLFFSDLYGSVWDSLKRERENLKTEKVEFIHNNVKTVVHVQFSESGYPTACWYEAEPQIDKEEELKKLEKQLKLAVKAEEFLKAAELKKKIDQLNQ